MKYKILENGKKEYLGKFIIYNGMVYTDPENNKQLPVTLEELGYINEVENK